MWGYPRIKIIACRNSDSGIYYSYTACPKTAKSIGHTWCFWKSRFLEYNVKSIMWGYPRISIFACRNSDPGLCYSYSACPKTPNSIGHTWPFWKSRFLEYNVRAPENINFRMSEFGLGTMLFEFGMPDDPQIYRAYMVFLEKSIFGE